jgi:hypothetical protein
MTNKNPENYQDEGTGGSFYERVPYPDHPERCQAVAAGGDQCTFFHWPRSREGAPSPSKMCKMHGGAVVAKSMAKKAVSQYNLAKYKANVEKFASHDGIFNLRDEIGILRMTLETGLNRINNDDELVMASARITLLVKQIKETVEASKKLESQLGELMDRAAISRLCDSLISIIGDVVPEDRMPDVADRVAAAIASAVSSRMEGT